jgi:hypothetical protein
MMQKTVKTTHFTLIYTTLTLILRTKLFKIKICVLTPNPRPNEANILGFGGSDVSENATRHCI